MSSHVCCFITKKLTDIPSDHVNVTWIGISYLCNLLVHFLVDPKRCSKRICRSSLTLDWLPLGIVLRLSSVFILLVQTFLISLGMLLLNILMNLTTNWIGTKRNVYSLLSLIYSNFLPLLLLSSLSLLVWLLPWVSDIRIGGLILLHSLHFKHIGLKFSDHLGLCISLTMQVIQSLEYLLLLGLMLKIHLIFLVSLELLVLRSFLKLVDVLLALLLSQFMTFALIQILSIQQRRELTLEVYNNISLMKRNCTLTVLSSRLLLLLSRRLSNRELTIVWRLLKLRIGL